MSDGATVRDERGEVVSVDRIEGGMVELVVRLPHVAAHVKPGQFCQLRVAGSVAPLLRRPFSVAWTEADACHFVFAPGGAGTRALATLRAGDVVEALGPLGHGFNLDVAATRAVCVGGGLGCAPFPLLAARLRARGMAVEILNGAATASRLYPVDRFQRGDTAITVVEATDDGSRGVLGSALDLLGGRIDAQTVLYACGPMAMLAELAKRLDAEGTQPAHAEASLEAPMGCGFGICLGCPLPVRGERQWALCCTDGPVMPVAEIDWGRVIDPSGAHVA